MQQFVRSIVCWPLVFAGFPGSTGFASASATVHAACFQDGPVDVPGSPIRMWTSSDGKFSVEGRLIAVEGKNIRLESGQGKPIQVAMEKLSTSDQAFILEESSRAANEAENPFKEAGAMGATSPFKTDRAPNPANLNVDPEMLKVRTVELVTESSADPSAAHWQEQSRKPVQKFRVNAFSFHAQPTNSFSAADEKIFAISFFEPFGVSVGGAGANASSGPVKAWVELLTLPEAKSICRFPLQDERSIAGDIDPSGKFLLTYDGTFAQEPKFRLFEIARDRLILLSSWFSKNSAGRNENATSAKILSDGKVATCFTGQLIVWSLNPVEPVFSIANDSPESWQLSSDRRHAWVVHGGKKFEIDLVDGKCTGVVGDPAALGNPSEAATADGQRFATLKDSMLTIRSASGEILDQFFAPVFWPNPKLAWLDDTTIRVESPNQHHFIDVPRRSVFLEVTNTGNAPSATGWSVEKQNAGNEIFVTVEQITAVGQQTPNLEQYRRQLPTDPEAMLLFRDRDKIALSIQLDFAPNLRGEVQSLLKEVLESRGVTIDENAADQLRASSTSRDETIEYRRFGSPPWDPNSVEKVNVKIVENQLQLVRGGKVVWSRSSASGPGFILHMNENESAQQAVDRQTGDPMQFWKSFVLPKHVASHPNGSAWSKLLKNSDGYQEIN